MKKQYNFALQLVMAKLEFDGNTIEPFTLLDYAETIPLVLLEKRLDELYEKAKKKIKEIKDTMKGN